MVAYGERMSSQPGPRVIFRLLSHDCNITGVRCCLLLPLECEFLKMVLAKSGQTTFEKDGYIPLPAKVTDKELARLHLAGRLLCLQLARALCRGFCVFNRCCYTASGSVKHVAQRIKLAVADMLQH